MLTFLFSFFSFYNLIITVLEQIVILFFFFREHQELLTDVSDLGIFFSHIPCSANYDFLEGQEF